MEFPETFVDPGPVAAPSDLPASASLRERSFPVDLRAHHRSPNAPLPPPTGGQVEGKSTTKATFPEPSADEHGPKQASPDATVSPDTVHATASLAAGNGPTAAPPNGTPAIEEDGGRVPPSREGAAELNRDSAGAQPNTLTLQVNQPGETSHSVQTSHPSQSRQTGLLVSNKHEDTATKRCATGRHERGSSGKQRSRGTRKHSGILGRVISQAQMTEAISDSPFFGEYALFSRRSAEKEPPNEDAAVVIPIADRGVVLAVADGVGGLPQGEEAARIALQTLVEFVTRSPDPDRLRIDIIDAIERANRRVLALGGNAATTLAVAQIIDHRIRTYHVGDSEIFVVGGRGAVKLQTLAHGPVAYGVHCGLIDPVEALAHEHRNLVSNIVGSHDMRIELGPQLKLAPRDLVVLCSDGITDNLYAEQIVSTVKGKSPAAASKAILEALQYLREPNKDFEFKEDDATFVLYRRPKVRRNKKADEETSTHCETAAHPPPSLLP